MPETTNAREVVLARIRAAMPRPAETGPDTAWEKIQRDYKSAAELSAAETLHLLEDRLVDYDAQVFHCCSAQIAESIGHALRQRGKRSMVIPTGIPEEWLPQKFRFVQDADLSANDLDNLDGVLTGATVAIADTGTIVLQNVAGQGRRAATLVPDYHLCVLFTSQVVQTVPQAVRILQATSTLPMTLISGPSATADIEMTRIKGVHGPRFLDVLLVNDSLPDSGAARPVEGLSFQ